MSKNSTALTGHADGFYGPDNFPVKFTYSGAFGFLISQVGMNKISSWGQSYLEDQSEVHGWGAPFKTPNGGLINNGVGTILAGPYSTPYDNKIRLTPKNEKVGVKRGIKANIMPTNTIDWMSEDFSDCLQWQGPPTRYFDPEGWDFRHSTNGGTPFVPGNVYWFGVDGENGDYPVDVTLNGQPATIPTSGVDWPFTAVHGNYNDAAALPNGDRISHIPYSHDEAFAPLGFEHLYGSGVYLNGKLIAHAPIEDNRAIKCQVDEPENAVGQKGMVQGGSIRRLDPLQDYYTAIDDLDTYITKEAAGAKDDWVVVATHEWYMHNATMKNLAYVADRVYTAPLWLQGGEINNGELANSATLANLEQLISVSTGDAKETAIADYKKEYRKWRIIGTNEVAVDGTYPEEVTDWKSWFLGVRIHHHRAESFSYEPWLFNQSGNEALQVGFWRDPVEDSLIGTANPMLKKMTLGSGPFGAVTFGYFHGLAADDASDFYHIVYTAGDPSTWIGEALLAADYQGDILVEATVSVDDDNSGSTGYVVNNETLNLPWPLVIGKYTLGASAIDDQIDSICIGALDLRYNFIAYSFGTSTVDADNNFTTVSNDFIAHNSNTPTQVGSEYGPKLEEGRLDGPYSTAGWRATLRPNGDSVVFINANTYILAHTLGKGDYWDQLNNGYGGLSYMTQPETITSNASNTVQSSRYVYSRVVVNGSHLGTIDEVAGHYAPYYNSGKVNYSVKLG